MIVDILISLFTGMATTIARMMPTTPLPPAFGSIFQSAGVYLGQGAGLVDQVLPITDLLLALTAVFGVKVIMEGIKLLVWLLAIGHVSGTR